jgi:hypothetical protein
MSTLITFDAIDWPANMKGTRIISLVASPTISNIRIRHVLIDGDAGLNVMSQHAFEALQIPLSKLTPSCSLGGVGNDPLWPYGHISLPVTFKTAENYCTELVVFNITDIELP